MGPVASNVEPEAHWRHVMRPSARLEQKVREFEATAGDPDLQKRGFVLVEEQHVLTKWFGAALDIAWKEECDDVPMNNRSQRAALLIGAGGTGKTTIVLKLLLEVFVEYFPPMNGENRYIVVTFSHAQGDAISNERFRAETAHASTGYRVASLRNRDMALKAKKKLMETKWTPKILLVQDEVSLFPGMVQNMLLYRTMRSRQNVYDLEPGEYYHIGDLFGHMPIVLIAGDFLQIKPANDVSLADDLAALKEAGRNIHPEHAWAQEAVMNIPDVIHLKKSKRFLDEKMSSLMEALRMSRPDAPLPEEELAKLRSRKIEKCKKELFTPLFTDGHVVSLYWENIARSIVERSVRDAMKLNVPLYCLQAADQRAAFKSKKHEEQVIHSLLTTPNIHKTGKLCGMLLAHVGMWLRLSDVLSPRNGLVKDKLGKVVAVELHPHDQRRLQDLPPGYRLFVPEYMAQVRWLLMETLFVRVECPLTSIDIHCHPLTSIDRPAGRPAGRPAIDVHGRPLPSIAVH